MSYLWGTLHWTDKQAQRTCKSPQATDTRPKIHPVVNPLPIVMAVFFSIFQFYKMWTKMKLHVRPRRNIFKDFSILSSLLNNSPLCISLLYDILKFNVFLSITLLNLTNAALSRRHNNFAINITL